MSPNVVTAAVEPRLHRLYAWFDPESAAVVTILLGLFQVLLSIPLASTDQALPKFFILPLVVGITIVAGGSLAIANERNTSRLLLQGCACSNVVGLLGALLAFCLYCYSLSVLVHKEDPCMSNPHGNSYQRFQCPGEVLASYCWNLTVLLLLYDTVAMVLHCLLSVSTLKALKTN